ncbi:hypothetical protein R1flu_013984 [Riccia fluitans]|uniref:Uncharacterized protein n=1 Tax=Riccia fluitans TaxID=41844 RepID=A0ABD1YET8_9MARC
MPRPVTRLGHLLSPLSTLELRPESAILLDRTLSGVHPRGLGKLAALPRVVFCSFSKQRQKRDPSRGHLRAASAGNPGPLRLVPDLLRTGIAVPTANCIGLGITRDQVLATILEKFADVRSLVVLTTSKSTWSVKSKRVDAHLAPLEPTVVAHSRRRVESIAALDIHSRCSSFTGSHSEITAHATLSRMPHVSPHYLLYNSSTVDTVERERSSRPTSYVANYGATKGQPRLGLAYARPMISLPPLGMPQAKNGSSPFVWDKEEARRPTGDPDDGTHPGGGPLAFC